MTNVLKCSLVVALAMAMLSGCGKTEEKKPADGGAGGGGGAPVPDNTVEVKPDAATVGKITVTVKLKGAAPARAPIDMSDAECAAAHASEPALDETVVPGSGGTLQNAMVWIEKGLDAKYVFKAPAAAVLVDQSGCIYKPHVLTMMTKQSIEVKNSDGVQHNIHATSKANPEFNFSQAPKTSLTLTTGSKDRTFTQPEVPLKMKCEIHGWMGAWVGVFKHPYHGVSGADGTVTLKDVPPGTYTITVWHEKFGKKEAQVTLKDKGAEAASVEFGE
ncbi:MAG: hypothetical protein AAB074_18080 [Planctomycetota bacterium]